MSLNKALNIAYQAHHKQTDKQEMPTLAHVFRVAGRVHGWKTTNVALLHDVVEDADYTLEDLQESGFSEDVIESVDIITHRDKEYREYVRDCKENFMARKVKIADLKDHLSDERIHVIQDIEKEGEPMDELYNDCLNILCK